MKLKREELLMKLGAAKQKSPSAWRLVQIEVDKDKAALTYRLDREKLRRQRRREGCYLLRTTLTETDPAKLWSLYLQLVNVEEAFKNLKGDLAIWRSGRSFIKAKNGLGCFSLIASIAIADPRSMPGATGVALTGFPGRRIFQQCSAKPRR
jgi:hypothetical protein